METRQPSTTATTLSSSRWPAGAILGALRLPELAVEVPSLFSTASPPPFLCAASLRNLQCIAGGTPTGARSLAGFLEGARVEVCGHTVVEVAAAGEDVATGTMMVRPAAVGGGGNVDVSLPALRLHLPLAADDVAPAVDGWAAALCAPTGLLLALPPRGGEVAHGGFPYGSVGACLLQLATTTGSGLQPLPPPSHTYDLRLRVRRASVSVALGDAPTLYGEAQGMLLECIPPSVETDRPCIWTCGAPALSLALVAEGGETVAVLPTTEVELRGVAAAGGPSCWAAEVALGSAAAGEEEAGALRASVSSELADALATVQQRLSGLACRLSLAPPSPTMAPGAEQVQQLTTAAAAQQAVTARLGTATHAAQVHLAAARQDLGAALAAHRGGRERAAAGMAGWRAAVAAKELQRRHLAALHHADHAGFLHVGTLTATVVPTATTAGAARDDGATVVVRSTAKAKALLALPRRWCVLRGELLLVYDHPHSFHLERALTLAQHGSGCLREVALADARAGAHHRRVYVLVHTKGEATTAGLPLFLACEAGGAEAAAWRAALQQFFFASEDAASQHHPPPSVSTTATPPPKRRFPLLPSPRSASSTASAGAAHRAPSPASASSLKPPSVFARRPPKAIAAVGTPVTADGPHPPPPPPPSLLLSTPASSAAAAAGPAPCEEPVVLVPTVAVCIAPLAASSGAMASYILAAVSPQASVLLGARESANDEPSSRAASPFPPLPTSAGPATVMRSWGEIAAFHHEYFPRWLQATAAAARQGREQQHAPTGMGPDEAMAYADTLLRGSHALLHAPAAAEAERREQCRVVSLYLQLLVAACPPAAGEGGDDAGSSGCRAALQRFLGLSMLPSLPFLPQEEAAHGAKEEEDPVAVALQSAGARLRRAEAALLRMRLAGSLQAAVAADAGRAAAAERQALCERVAGLEAALAAERARGVALSAEAGQAALARDDAVQAMTEVATDGARKLMLGELRYLSLLRRAHPAAYAAEQEGHSRRHSHHHATKPAGPSPPPPPSSLSAARASPPPPPHVLTRAASSGVGGSLSPRAAATARRLSSAGLEDSSRSVGGRTDGAVTTAHERRQQLEQLLRQPTPPPRSPRSLTPPPTVTATAATQQEGTVTRAHHTEVVFRLKSLLAAREEEARALREALALAQEEAEGRAHRARAWRLLAAGNDEGGDGDGDCGDDDGLFAPWRARMAAERAARLEVEERLAATRAQWAGLVEALSSVGFAEEEGEGMAPEEEWARAWGEYEKLLALAQGLQR